jgi:hypothetical protein
MTGNLAYVRYTLGMNGYDNLIRDVPQPFPILYFYRMWKFTDLVTRQSSASCKAATASSHVLGHGTAQFG